MRPETGRAVLAATPHLSPAPGGPGLSDLAGRIAAARTLALVDATLPPAPSPPVPAQPVPVMAEPGAAGVALVAAHGGAGVSSLLRCGLDRLGAFDAERCWPATGHALLVARTSTGGLEQVRELARQHATGHVGGDIELLGLVLIADAPGRLPLRVRELADLVCGGFTRSWRLPWLEEWRLAAASEPLPVPPDAAQLLDELRRLTAPAFVPTHSVRSTRGVLL